jgi:hypothetical protein
MKNHVWKRYAGPRAREHDGTNSRGLTRRCQFCGTPLIPTAESEICARCLTSESGDILQSLNEAFRRAKLSAAPAAANTTTNSKAPAGDGATTERTQ